MSLLAGYLVPHPPIIIPDIGMGEERKITATSQAYHEIAKEIGKLEPETIIVISPHGPVFTDAITLRTASPLVGDLSSFGAPQIGISQRNDLELVDQILMNAYDQQVSAVKFDKLLASRFDLNEVVDHGVIVPLHFINQYYKSYQLVVITYGLLSEEALYQFGICIKAAIEKLKRNVVVVASGDLSHHLLETDHYTYTEDGPVFDKLFIDYLANQSYVKLMTMPTRLVTKAGECGKKSVEILLGCFETMAHKTQVKSYEGPFGVGYSVASFVPTLGQSESLLSILKEELHQIHVDRVEKEDEYIKLARMAIEHYTKTRQRLNIPEFAQTPDLLGKSRGVFVSIKDSGGLRGCMGITAGIEINLASDIISNAIKACSEDPRFPAVEEEELEHLIISVDILSPAESVSDPSELNPKKYGVIVTHDYKRGLLLPNLEGVDSVEEQLRIALNKAGIKPSESYEIERFTVDRHEV